MVASQGRDVNSLRSYKLSYVNSVDLLSPLSHQDTVFVNRLDELEGLLVKSIKFADQTDKKTNSLTSKLTAKHTDGVDDDEDSQSSLNEGTILDFLRGAQK